MHCRFMRRVALFAAVVLVVPVLAAPMAALAQGKAKGKAQEKAQDRAQLDSVTIHVFLETSGSPTQIEATCGE
jgi:hypothetical protein